MKSRYKWGNHPFTSYGIGYSTIRVGSLWRFRRKTRRAQAKGVKSQVMDWPGWILHDFTNKTVDFLGFDVTVTYVTNQIFRDQTCGICLIDSARQIIAHLDK